MRSRFASAGARVLLVIWCVTLGNGRESYGANHRTRNFSVDAPTAAAARAVAEKAEAFRRQIAQEWLGKPLPDWSRPCPVRVVLTQGEAGGLTSFAFGKNNIGVLDQSMKLEGRLDRILASALPHEVTHTVLTSYLNGPLPRWADEGAALLAEDDRERQRHDHIAVDLLARKAGVPIRTLFQTEEYPSDLLGFYGQGYSVTRFLVEIGGRPRFLRFLKEGMTRGWDLAIQNQYGLTDCIELDRAWRSWHVVIAQNESRKPSGSNAVTEQYSMQAPANLGND